MKQKFEVLREKVVGTNKLGESITEQIVIHKFDGYIDLIGGTDQQTVQNANIADSTHLVFTGDTSFIPLISDHIRHVNQNQEYEVTYSDNPMYLNHHLEIYLRQVV